MAQLGPIKLNLSHFDWVRMRDRDYLIWYSLVQGC